MDIVERLRGHAKGNAGGVRELLVLSADEIERLRAALHHCVKALAEFEKDSNLPIEQFQYNVVFKLKGYLLGALDNARLATGMPTAEGE